MYCKISLCCKNLASYRVFARTMQDFSNLQGHRKISNICTNFVMHLFFARLCKLSFVCKSLSRHLLFARRSQGVYYLQESRKLSIFCESSKKTSIFSEKKRIFESFEKSYSLSRILRQFYYNLVMKKFQRQNRGTFGHYQLAPAYRKHSRSVDDFPPML